MTAPDDGRKPIHHYTRTVAFDGPDAADVLAQAADYCAQFHQPVQLRGVNIDYDAPPGVPSVCMLSLTYDDTLRRERPYA